MTASALRRASGGFPQPARGGQSPTSEGVGHVHQDQVQAAVESPVLETVVQQVEVGRSSTFDPASGPRPVLAYGDQSPGQVSGDDQGFVTGEVGVGPGAAPVGNRQRFPPVASLVTSQQHRHRVAGTLKHCAQCDDGRRLAGASQGQVADADHRPLEALDLEPAGVVTLVCGGGRPAHRWRKQAAMASSFLRQNTGDPIQDPGSGPLDWPGLFGSRWRPAAGARRRPERAQ